MIDCLLTITVVTAIAWVSYEIGRKVGYEEAQVDNRARRRLVTR